MIVINFDNKPHMLKGHIVGVGVNIISDDNITENDRTEFLGIGIEDMQYYKEIMQFFEIKGIFIDGESLDYKSLLERYNNLLQTRELLKKEASIKVENLNQEKSKLILMLNKQIETNKKACIFYNSKIKRENLTEAQLQAIEREYNDLRDYPYRFKIMEVVDMLYTQLITEKKQAYPFAYYEIQKDLGLSSAH